MLSKATSRMDPVRTGVLRSQYVVSDDSARTTLIQKGVAQGLGKLAQGSKLLRFRESNKANEGNGEKLVQTRKST